MQVFTTFCEKKFQDTIPHPVTCNYRANYCHLSGVLKAGEKQGVVVTAFTIVYKGEKALNKGCMSEFM